MNREVFAHRLLASRVDGDGDGEEGDDDDGYGEVDGARAEHEDAGVDLVKRVVLVLLDAPFQHVFRSLAHLTQSDEADAEHEPNGLQSHGVVL